MVIDHALKRWHCNPYRPQATLIGKASIVGAVDITTNWMPARNYQRYFTMRAY